MKKRITTLISSLLLIMGMALIFSSCDDGYGPPDPYPGGMTYIDRDLVGAWQLYAINGVPISSGETNYFEFNSNGNGRYYSMTNGRWYYEGISFWCKTYNNGYYQLNIQYSNGQSSSMKYWFDGRDDLFMQWRINDGRLVEYHYIYTNYLP